MSYATQSRALDDELLSVIRAWHDHGTILSEAGFTDLATRSLAYQLRHNQPYARYCAGFGITAHALPESWEQIPAVPAAAYKEAVLATFDPAHAALHFQTSGTTQGIGGSHYMETAELYDAALLAGFDAFMLADGMRLSYLNLVPNPHDRPNSSLGYMMGRVSALRGDSQTGWYVRGEELLIEALVIDLRAACTDRRPVCIAGTAFALVDVLDYLALHDLQFELPSGSRIMETGGFKGRSRVVERGALYDALKRRLGVPDKAIVAEYGMTELTSQYYDMRPSTTDSSAGESIRVTSKVGPPWLRARVVDASGETVPRGTVGALVHVDLANRSSCIAIATEDLGYETDDGFVLLGREEGAALRGCSLDAEELVARSR
ncbi:MAG: hypothetical protein ABI182_06855 [Candidatus Baltobacteraceae bacterium]